MGKREITKAIVGTLLLGAPVAGLAQAGWVPGSEIIGQSIQVETNGVTNTVFFDPGGVARIQTPSGKSVPGTWAAANGQLCMTSSCNSASRWTALGTNQAAPVQQGAGERG